MSIQLGRFSMGIGDRFGQEGSAQLKAFVTARDRGVAITPVWNKSNREHQIIHTIPDAVRTEADVAVRALSWTGAYHVDADHIGLKTVDAFVDASDFFTLDVADFTCQPADAPDDPGIRGTSPRARRPLTLPGLDGTLDITEARIEAIAQKYLLAVQEAGRLYRHIDAAKGDGGFVTEVSMDETDQPQTPVDLLFILAAIADERIPAQTIAPKFTGRFNKGVDYVGDTAQFEKEFGEDIAVIAFAVREFGLPANLKLSVHSGSDKFALRAHPPRAERLRRGRAPEDGRNDVAGGSRRPGPAGGDALRLAQTIYTRAFDRFDELCKPYASVIDIDRRRLPPPAEVQAWTGTAYAAALRHDQAQPQFNPHFRQLIHVGYKVAVELGRPFMDALVTYRELIGGLVTENLLEKHIRPLFLE